jgi:hypothetical protein
LSAKQRKHLFQSKEWRDLIHAIGERFSVQCTVLLVSVAPCS